MVPVLCLSTHGLFHKMEGYISGNLVHDVMKERESFDGEAFHVSWPSSLIDKIIKTEVYKDIQKNKDPLSVVMFNLNEIHVRQRKFGSNIFDNKEKVLLDYFQYMMKPQRIVRNFAK